MAVVAITGGTGFIGGHLARAVVAHGHHANIIVRGLNGRDAVLAIEPHINFTQACLTDEEALLKAFAGCDTVCHLTGINRERQHGDFERVHIDGTAQVIAAAQRAQVKKVVFVSFIRARPSKTSKYLDSKWKAEEIVRESGLDYTILKPGMVYGRDDQMIRSIVHGLELIPIMGVWPSVGICEKQVNPIFVDDFIRILVAAAVENRLSHQTVAVSGPDNITLTKAVDRVARVMHKPMLSVPTPIVSQYLMAFAMERIMSDPLVCVSQVRMLSEGMGRPLPESDLLPSDLIPKTYFTEESIRKSFDFYKYDCHAKDTHQIRLL